MPTQVNSSVLQFADDLKVWYKASAQDFQQLHRIQNDINKLVDWANK